MWGKICETKPNKTQLVVVDQYELFSFHYNKDLTESSQIEIISMVLKPKFPWRPTGIKRDYSQQYWSSRQEVSKLCTNTHKHTHTHTHTRRYENTTVKREWVLFSAGMERSGREGEKERPLCSYKTKSTLEWIVGWTEDTRPEIKDFSLSGWRV